MQQLFPFSEFWWLYIVFVAAVFGLLALDLGVFHRRPHQVRFREAAAWSAVWVSLALLFNLALYLYTLWASPENARQIALEFLSGYLVEYSLSVDNIFVFVLIFGYFAVPLQYQHRVLFFGILGALFFRAAFIALGAVLMRFHWVVLVFGVFLIGTGINMAVSSGEAVHPERNFVIRVVRRFFPVTHELNAHSFFVKKDGKTWATPLFAALMCLETSDIIFAVDSVPAIFALTKEPFIVFTSNTFAILGLRSLYFMLGGAVERFHLLRYGLAAVLIFVGVKMVFLDQWFGGRFPIGPSLLLIGAMLGISVWLSLIFPKRAEADKVSS